MRFFEKNRKPGIYRFWLAFPLLAGITFLFCVSFVPVKPHWRDKPYKIVIDAGHGGADAGATRGNSVEKNITLAVARLVAKEAADAGMEVVMTRTGDELPVPGDKDASLRKRIEIVQSADPDVFISLHVGAAEDDHNGVEAFVSRNENETTTLSKALAGSILHNMQNGPLKVNMQIRQQKETGIWILDQSSVPVVLLELGYITNNDDFKVLGSDNDLKKMASLIVEAIKTHSVQ